MDRNRGVHHLGLDRFLVDNRHDRLVNVVVNVLAGDCWSGGLSVVGFFDVRAVLEVA